jgi:putative ABC transport system permease protein
MSNVLYLAWRYLRFYWIKSFILIASISLILFVPTGFQVIVQRGSDMLTSRANDTPLLIGSKGSAIDLTLSALYFRQPTVEIVHFRELTQVNESGLAIGIPLHMRFLASGHRIVGTTLDYFDFRNLRIQEGHHFAVLGDCVLGAKAARALNEKVGGYIISTPAGAFDVAGTYPLKMKVVGILVSAGTADDEAVFVDIKTAWGIAGLAHGHMDITKPEAESGVLKKEKDNVVANASVLSYTEITAKNIDSFHFHGDPDDFPVDAIITVPNDKKSGILLRGRYEEQEAAVQMLVPLQVINNLLDTVFSVRDLILLGSLGVGLATIATAVLVFWLSIRLRQREIETIRKIGGPRRRIMAILGTEILIVVFASLIISAALTFLVSYLGGALVQLVAMS